MAESDSGWQSVQGQVSVNSPKQVFTGNVSVDLAVSLECTGPLLPLGSQSGSQISTLQPGNRGLCVCVSTQ